MPQDRSVQMQRLQSLATKNSNLHSSRSEPLPGYAWRTRQGVLSLVSAPERHRSVPSPDGSSAVQCRLVPVQSNLIKLGPLASESDWWGPNLWKKSQLTQRLFFCSQFKFPKRSVVSNAPRRGCRRGRQMLSFASPLCFTACIASVCICLDGESAIDALCCSPPPLGKCVLALPLLGPQPPRLHTPRVMKCTHFTDLF